jgi:hypothetical protein
MPVIDMLLHIWKDVQRKVFDRHQQAAAATLAGPFSSHIEDLYHHDDRSSRIYDACPSSPELGLVQSLREPEHEFKVCLQRTRWSCTCGDFQNNLRPCAHAFALIHRLRLAPINFIASFHTSAAWRQTYVLFLPPVMRSELSTSTVLPPALKRKRGRPKKKRMEQGMSTQRETTVESISRAEREVEIRATGDVQVDCITQQEDGSGLCSEEDDFDGIESVANGGEQDTMGMDEAGQGQPAHNQPVHDGGQRHSQARPKPSWEYVWEPIGPAPPVLLASRTRSGLL